MADSEHAGGVPITVRIVSLQTILILAKAEKESKKQFYKFEKDKSNKATMQEIYLYLIKPWLKTSRIS